MSDKQTTKDNMSEFQLGAAISGMRSTLESMNGRLSEVITDFKDVHKDHENRLRSLEKNCSTKNDTQKVHGRVDGVITSVEALKVSFWKLLVVVLVGGSSAGGTVAAVINMVYGGAG